MSRCGTIGWRLHGRLRRAVVWVRPVGQLSRPGFFCGTSGRRQAEVSATGRKAFSWIDEWPNVGIFVPSYAVRADREIMNDHPNKHIRAAVDYALERGWILRRAGARAHAWGRLYCPRHDREGCQQAVYCTPRVP